MFNYNEYITESKKEKIPIIEAAKKGSDTKVKSFIKSGVDINIINSDKRTALMEAVINSFILVVNTLIDYGADVNMQDDDGRTALMMARTNKIVDKILSAPNIDVNIKNNDGETVAMVFLDKKISSDDFINYLGKFLLKGLNLDIKDKDGDNLYDHLQYSLKDARSFASHMLEGTVKIEKYLDEKFPKYKEEWELKNAMNKYNI